MISTRFLLIFLLTLVLSSCASTTPLFTKSDDGLLVVRNEVPLHYSSTDSTKYKFRSFGYSENTYERDLKPVQWKKVDEFEVGRFTIVLHAKEKETNVLEHFLALPHDNVERKGNVLKREMLAKVVAETDALAAYVFDKKAARARVNFYLGIFNTEVKTPLTDWQYGPVIDPMLLNLAVMLPPLGEKYEREPDYDDARWHEQILRIMLHEYTHVVVSNAPSQFKTLLADEFTASTLDQCVAYGAHDFRNKELNSNLINAGKKFTADREFVTRGRPFATSTTGGELAATAVAALFSHANLANALPERWKDIFPQYCKMVVDAKPEFETTKAGLDWIDANVKNAELAFLEKLGH